MDGIFSYSSSCGRRAGGEKTGNVASLFIFCKLQNYFFKNEKFLSLKYFFSANRVL